MGVFDNHLLAEKIEHYEKTKQMLKNTPAHLKKEYEWLGDVDSMALCNAQMNLETAYSNFFRAQKAGQDVGFPKFRSKKNHRRTYTTNLINGNIRFVDGRRIRLPKLDEVDVVLHRPIPESHRMKSVTVEQTPSGKYFVSVLCEYDAPETTATVYDDNTRAVGLDFSMSRLFVASDGDVKPCDDDCSRHYRNSLEKLAREQRKLMRREKGAKNREKQRIRVARLHERIANQRKDFLHKTSARIANGYDIVCVEDLDMKAMSAALNFGKPVHDNGWGTFLTFLRYKLEDRGKKLVVIDRFYPSSKQCSNCGAVKDNLSLSERTYRCEACGNEMDRDLNAAVNIRSEGLRMLTAVA